MPLGSASSSGNPGRRFEQRGFTYVWMLAALALLSLGLAVVGERWSDEMRREREADLIRIGMLYAAAIESYYARSPGSAHQFPATLQDLLEDTRMVGTVRHLRRLYDDPIVPGQSLGLIRGQDGRIIGVFSQSSDTPLRSAPIELGILKLPSVAHYSDWKFEPKVAP